MADKSYVLSVLDVNWIREGLKALTKSLERAQKAERSQEGADLRGKELEQVQAVLSKVRA